MPRSAPGIALDSATRSTLEGWVQASCTPQAPVLRSRIVLQAAAGLSNQQIAAVLQVPEVTVGKWRRSFVALYMNPPENALILCVDEKPSIQALDRTQPLLPLRAKKPPSWANECVRHGRQTLIAALEMATGKVVAHDRNRRTSVIFVRFMNGVARTYPDRELHVVADNLNIHKNEALRAWLRRNPRVELH